MLARLRRRRPAPKGISLFAVPKFVPDAGGALGPRNGVACGSIEHKMGIHGNSTCVMNLTAPGLAARAAAPGASTPCS